VTARDRIVIVVVLIAAALAASWMLIIQPKRKQATSLGTQVASTQSQLDSVRSELAQGQSARRQFASEYTQMVRLGEAVPPDDNVPSLIYQIQSAAGAAKVDFRTLQVCSSGSTAPTTGTSSSAHSGSAQNLPPGVTVGPAGFPVEQFTFSFQGSFFHLSDFFNHLQRFVTANNHQISISGRLMTLNAINLSASPEGFPQITASVSATAYMLPASQGLVAGASPTGPASSSTGTPAATSSSSTPTAAAAVTSPLR
jgi:hypothetical protein